MWASLSLWQLQWLMLQHFVELGFTFIKFLNLLSIIKFLLGVGKFHELANIKLPPLLDMQDHEVSTKTFYPFFGFSCKNLEFVHSRTNSKIYQPPSWECLYFIEACSHTSRARSCLKTSSLHLKNVDSLATFFVVLVVISFFCLKQLTNMQAWQVSHPWIL